MISQDSDLFRNLFQSTLPTRGSDAIATLYFCCALRTFQSTLPTRGSDSAAPRPRATIAPFQSTLPTRGSDICKAMLKWVRGDISIHAPHEGERPRLQCVAMWTMAFQSTLPTRGSDRYAALQTQRFSKFQSTLPTRGSDGGERLGQRAVFAISIHAPHEGERRLPCPLRC